MKKHHNISQYCQSGQKYQAGIPLKFQENTSAFILRLKYTCELQSDYVTSYVSWIFDFSIISRSKPSSSNSRCSISQYISHHWSFYVAFMLLLFIVVLITIIIYINKSYNLHLCHILHFLVIWVSTLWLYMCQTNGLCDLHFLWPSPYDLRWLHIYIWDPSNHLWVHPAHMCFCVCSWTQEAVCVCMCLFYNWEEWPRDKTIQSIFLDAQHCTYKLAR